MQKHLIANIITVIGLGLILSSVLAGGPVQDSVGLDIVGLVVFLVGHFLLRPHHLRR